MFVISQSGSTGHRNFWCSVIWWAMSTNPSSCLVTPSVQQPRQGQTLLLTANIIQGYYREMCIHKMPNIHLDLVLLFLGLLDFSFFIMAVNSIIFVLNSSGIDIFSLCLKRLVGGAQHEDITNIFILDSMQNVSLTEFVPEKPDHTTGCQDVCVCYSVWRDQERELVSIEFYETWMFKVVFKS